jgi:hypothetical protein
VKANRPREGGHASDLPIVTYPLFKMAVLAISAA